MAKYAKLINENDNVVTAVSDIQAGEEITVRFEGRETRYRCNQNLPFGHKMAVDDIKLGNKIIKYGQAIGSASQDIKQGDWVHTHNVKDDYKVLDKDGKPFPGQEN